MRALITTCAVLLMIGCGDSTGPSASVAGTWTLQSLNGFAVPFKSPRAGGDTLELTSDVITATASGTFTQMTVVKTTTSGLVTIDSIPDAGTYSVKGNVVTFDFTSNAPNGSGLIDGNTMTVTTDIRLVYVR